MATIKLPIITFMILFYKSAPSKFARLDFGILFYKYLFHSQLSGRDQVSVYFTTVACTIPTASYIQRIIRRHLTSHPEDMQFCLTMLIILYLLYESFSLSSPCAKAHLMYRSIYDTWSSTPLHYSLHRIHRYIVFTRMHHTLITRLLSSH